ncbi:unnamed protein product [Camellia sinensis]
MVDASTPKRNPNPNPNPNPSSSETVANNDDLLNKILLHLPIRSLLRFKSVSKHWLSLITNSPRPSGLFLYRYSHQIHPDFDFLSLLNYESPSKPPFNALTFVDDPSDLRILQSCNGLLLCRGLHLYIYNPTTSQFATLPQPPRRVLSPLCCLTTCYDYNLAFDPSKSPHYKVVSVNFSWGLPDHYELEIFSSETGLWSPSGDPFNSDVSFNLGVFWNGALHWISTFGGDSLYFNVDEEHLETMPMPPIPDGWEERRPRYFRESRDHLHLIEIYGPRTMQFNVYEMERDYCEWFVKYRVDLDAIPNVFPEMIRSSLDPSDLHYYQFAILGLIREESDEESFLVLHVPGKVIPYNFRDKSFRELFDVPHRPDNECFSFEALKLATLNANTMYTIIRPNNSLHFLHWVLVLQDLHGVNFAFDPSKSPHYKVICVRSLDLSSEHYQIEIYSSNTGPWRVSGQPFTTHVNIQFNGGVYWNSALHWLSIREDSLCFDVDKECLQIMPMPPLPSGYDWRWFNYFGESGDHLHLIEKYRPPSMQFNIYELERDGSEWFVKYRIDLDSVAAEFPEMIPTRTIAEHLNFYKFVILSVVVRRETTSGGGGGGEESFMVSSFMVLHINGKVMRYSFEDKSLKKLCDFAASAPGRP